MTAPADIDDFRPPYQLGAYGCALVGTWDGGGAEPVPPGFEPMHWLGEPVGAALVLRYDRPPAEHPVPYSEIICARVVRRRGSATIAAVPYDLVLDDAFFVEAGLRYYHLPKRLDASLGIDLTLRGDAPTHLTASGADVGFDADLAAVRLPLLGGAASALMRTFTGHVPVIGTAREPPLAASIRLAPDRTTMRLARVGRFVARARALRPLGALFWRRLAITVGEPVRL